MAGCVLEQQGRDAGDLGAFYRGVVLTPLLAQYDYDENKNLVRATNQEKGPAGEMSLKTMLHWCERAMAGRKIDTIITDVHQPLLNPKYQQMVLDLASNNHEWRHDRNKLKHAVDRLIASR